MGERKVELDLTKDGSASGNIEIKEIETRQSRKARLAEVYERGLLGDRLHVPLPPDKHGEWVPNDVVSIDRKRSLGYEIDTVHANKRALHDKGDGASYVGDVVFMTCSMETKEIIDELRRERYNSLHAPKKGTQIEERQFVKTVEPESGPTAESRSHQAKIHDIKDALEAASNQKL